jgi:hypothetical protein
MTKSQVDSTLIEERISAMIAEHNDDPTAHMADSQSIGLHRINDILDHPAGSTLADKWTMSEMEFTTNFENLNLFTKVGTVNQLWPGINIVTKGTGTPKVSKLVVDGETNLLNFDTSLEFLAQFVAYVDQEANEHSRFLYGDSMGSGSYCGVGLKVDGGVAQFFAGKDDSSSVNYLQWPTFEAFVTYVIRIHNVPAEGVIRVYINGELLGTLTWPESITGPLTVQFIAESSVGGGNTFYVRSFFFSQMPS